MEENFTKFEQLLAAANEISSLNNFDTFCNSRKFEDEVVEIERKIIITSELEKEITDYIDKNKDINNKLCFVLFFILFTLYRKNEMGDLESFTDKYISNFNQYPISEFIKLLTIYNVKKDNEHLNELLKSSKLLSESKGETYDFTTHQGINNLYVEVVCTYFELNSDERLDKESNLFLKDAINKIDKIIDSCNGKIYSKFYLNKGRLEALKGNYNKGEEYIIKAIRAIELGPNRSYTVNQYQYYLTKIDMIRRSDITNKKMKEVEKVKVDNIKSLTLMTALLSFILGAINIFSSTKKTLVLGILMASYFGLILTLTGILLFGLKLMYNEKNSKHFLYTLFIFIAGIVIFAVSIILSIVLA